jgi:preprotein translocase subunit SecB
MTTATADATNEAPAQFASPLVINAQYIKDLSFEQPDALQNLKNAADHPEIGINIDVNAQNVQDNMYEVTLTVQATATRNKETIFINELQYAGLFTIAQDVPKEAIHPILMIECPRLLFPYARSIIANTTREGGFPPLSLNPIDFAGLYRQQMEQMQQGTSEADSGRPN